MYQLEESRRRNDWLGNFETSIVGAGANRAPVGPAKSEEIYQCGWGVKSVAYDGTVRR